MHRYSEDDEKRMEAGGVLDDVNLLFESGILSRDLADFIWDPLNFPKIFSKYGTIMSQVDFLIDLMRRTMLLGDWKFGERNEMVLGAEHD